MHNRLLSARLAFYLHDFTLLFPQRLPAGDGGLSLGQGVIAAAWALAQNKKPRTGGARTTGRGIPTVATHIHVREVNKSSNGILYLHGQRFQQRKGLFHAVFADDKGT